MRASLWIEIIGPPDNSWVAEVSACDGNITSTIVPHVMCDYSHANTKGTRGVKKGYLLEEGQLYEVSSPLSWKRIDRYYCSIASGKIKRIDAKGVLEWAKRASE